MAYQIPNNNIGNQKEFYVQSNYESNLRVKVFLAFSQIATVKYTSAQKQEEKGFGDSLSVTRENKEGHVQDCE